jgi:hypothetical protein
MGRIGAYSSTTTFFQMNHFLYFLLLAPLGMLLSSSAAPSSENNDAFTDEWMYVQPFQVISSAADPALDQNHAQFELQFDDDILTNQPLANRPVRIELSCNGVIHRFLLDSTMKTTIDVSPGTYQFMAIANADSAVYNEISSDSIVITPGHKMVIQVHLVPLIEIDNSRRIVAYKPVIYLYPEKDLAVQVKLWPAGEFTFTYPAYENGWNGTAHPDGSMTIGKTRYPYLFWEGKQENILQLEDYSTGFVVNREEITAFLEEKLTQMGLNDTEKTDFITFWGPRMANSGQGLAHFLFTEDYDHIATLDVQPKPQSVFRLYLLWTPLDADLQLRPEPQTLPVVDRTGFCVVEWGGSELPLLTEQLTLK